MTHEEPTPTRADAERAIRAGMTHEGQPKFKHQTLWVALMWAAIVVFAVWYWQHPHLWINHRF